MKEREFLDTYDLFHKWELVGYMSINFGGDFPVVACSVFKKGDNYFFRLYDNSVTSDKFFENYVKYKNKHRTTIKKDTIKELFKQKEHRKLKQMFMAYEV